MTAFKPAFPIIATTIVLFGCVSIDHTTTSSPPTKIAAHGLPEAPDKDAILSTIDQFFEALATSDADTMETLIPEGSLAVTAFPEEPERAVRYGKNRTLIESMRNGTLPKIEEPYWDPIVLQRKNLAVVWAPYEVWVREKLSHCGIDVFNLTKQDDRWKIDSVHWTQEPSACLELWPEGRSVLRPDMFN